MKSLRDHPKPDLVPLPPFALKMSCRRQPSQVCSALSLEKPFTAYVSKRQNQFA
jgi:hypothetical protein